LAFFTANIFGRDLKQSNWIWTNDEADASTARAFQRVYTPEDGKIPVSAQIVVASGQKHDLYVNNHHIGDEHDVDGRYADQSLARVRTAFLNPGQNVFTIKTHGRHGPVLLPPTGVLSSIVMTFNDGSQRELPSDTEWVATTLPNDEGEHHWGRVKVLGAYGDEPWGKIIVLPEPASGYHGGHHHHNHKHHHQHATPTFLESYCSHVENHLPPLTTPRLTYLNDAMWIWTNETDSAFNDPLGSRAFRKIVCLDKGTTINALNITIDLDDQFSIFVQGMSVANSTAATWDTTFHYLVNFSKPISGPDAVVIAIEGTNVLGYGNLITAIDFLGKGPSGTGLQGVVISDHTWKFNLTVPTDFQQPEFDDSSWQNAHEYGTYAHGAYAATGLALVDNPTLNTVNL